MAKRRTKKNPSTTTWLLIAGGVGIAAYLYWNVNKQIDDLAKTGALIKPAKLTDNCDANRAEIARLAADLNASEYKTECDVNKPGKLPAVCTSIAEYLMMLPAQWPQACGPMPQF